MSSAKTVLIVGANSDVARQVMMLYHQRGYFVVAASRSLDQLHTFVKEKRLDESRIDIRYFDATAFETHPYFIDNLPIKPHIVIYAAGFLMDNTKAMHNWQGTHQMMKVHYEGAVSIINIIVNDASNKNLERIIGLSSLSGVRGRKSNFIYGSTKAAFTQYLAGLRQFLFDRKIHVNVIVAGYIRSKMTKDLALPESLLLEPEFIARAVVLERKRFVIVPGFKWKLIYAILRLLPEGLVARLP